MGVLSVSLRDTGPELNVHSSFIGLGVNGYARCLSHIFIHVDGAMAKNAAQATIYQSKKMNTTHHS